MAYMMNEKKNPSGRRKNHYWRKILDVSRCDSWKIVNAKYKRLVLVIHPDKNPHKNQQQYGELFHEITKAKEELLKLYKVHNMNICM